MLWRPLLPLLLFISAVNLCQAQQDTFAQYMPELRPSSKLFLSLGLQTAIPQGLFANDVPKPGYGANLQLGYRLPSLPIEFLASFDLIFYGYQKEGKQLGPATQPNFEIIVDRFQYMLPLHLHLRYAPEWGKFTPYCEAFGGMRLIASRTRALGNELISTPTNPEAFSARADYYDFSPSYGAGFGLSYKLADFGGVLYKFNFDSRFMFGGKANYLGTDDLKLNGNQLIYSPRFNETNLVLIKLGVSALF